MMMGMRVAGYYKGKWTRQKDPEADAPTDGILFQLLFNLMYDEHINCKLKPSALVEDRLLNWNRINSMICFNYLQQRFYLVEPTMKSLALGKNSDAIFTLIKVLISTQQEDYAMACKGTPRGSMIYVVRLKQTDSYLEKRR